MKKKFEDWIPTNNLPSSRSLDDFEQKNSILFKKYIAVNDFNSDLIEDINNEEHLLFDVSTLNQKNDSEILASGREWFEEGDDHFMTVDNELEYPEREYSEREYPEREYPEREYPEREQYIRNRHEKFESDKDNIEKCWLEQWNTDENKKAD